MRAGQFHRAAWIGVVLALAVPRLTSAATISTLVTFNVANGSAPRSALIADGAGNLYGTTGEGGASTYGTVFKLDASSNYALSTLTTFNGTNGREPYAALIADGSGNLYGTTSSGGNNNYGTVFRLNASSNYALSTLATFNGSNGRAPIAGLIADAAGNLYGTTVWGGAGGDYGTVFKIAASSNYALSTLATFNYTNGRAVYGGLIADGAGNLYGTNYEGGASNFGTVFKLDASSNYAVSTLMTFNGANGSNPFAGLIADEAGNLYGTTYQIGRVFKLDASSNYALSTLATFNGINGMNPYAGLIADGAGNLYGTTYAGGATGNGTVFKLDASSNYALSTLASFNGANGRNPFGGLVADAAGNLYGTTEHGGATGNGTVFQLTGSGFVVPEPSSLALLAVAAVHALYRRRTT
jgi:uncharacterized repeat protein (TIGR03803 family)